MATGIIQHLAELRLPSPFPHALLLPTQPEHNFPELSEEEEDDDEEEEAAEGADHGEQDPAGASAAETPLRLLRFSELISGDIQRYFGPGGRAEDAEGRTEDCRSPRRSGREPCPAEPPRSAQPLGPLAELFEYGLQQCRQPPGKQRRDRRHGHITPMHERKLPQSFWREPGPGPALHPSTPDFSDLLANWTAEPAPELPGAALELPPAPELSLVPGRSGLAAEHLGAL